MPIWAAGLWDEIFFKNHHVVLAVAPEESYVLLNRSAPLFSPAVAAARVAADKEERHPLLASCSRLQHQGTKGTKRTMVSSLSEVSRSWSMKIEEDDAIASS